MGHERWFRGQHDGRNRPFDWLTAARQHGIPDRLARVLYEQAKQQTHGANPVRVQEMYLALLADVRQEAARPSPGKVTRTMRLQAHRAGKRRRPHVSRLTGQPIAPGKRPLTSYVEPAEYKRYAREKEREPPEIAAAATARAVPFGAGRPSMQHIMVPGTLAHRQFQANLAAAFGHFEELQALEEELVNAEPAATLEASEPSDIDEGHTAGWEANGWRLPASFQITLESQAHWWLPGTGEVHADRIQPASSIDDGWWSAGEAPFHAQMAGEDEYSRPPTTIAGRTAASWGMAGPIQAAGMTHVVQQSQGRVRATTHAMPTAVVERATARAHGQVQFESTASPGHDDPTRIHQLADAGISGAGGPLPHFDAIQHSFGHHDVSDVIAHVGGPAVAAASGMDALAYAAGNHVAFARAPDLQMAAHEAAHVVQQRRGVRLSHGIGQRGDAFERHADAVAALVVRGESAEALLDQHAPHGPAVTQRQVMRWANHPSEAVQSRHYLQAAIRSAGSQAEVDGIIRALEAPTTSEGLVTVQLPGDTPVQIVDVDIPPLLDEARRRHQAVAPVSQPPAGAADPAPQPGASRSPGTVGGNAAQQDREVSCASGEALAAQVETHGEIAAHRVATARTRGEQTYQDAQQHTDEIVQASQDALAAVDTWRHSIDQAALRRLETEHAGLLAGAVMENLWWAASFPSDLNPVTRSVYEIIDRAVAIGGAVAEANEIADNRLAVEASGDAHRLAVNTSDDLLRRILTAQHTAIPAVSEARASLREQTGTQPGQAAGVTSSLTQDEGRDAREACDDGAVQGRVGGAERAAGHALDVADRAEALLAELERVCRALAAAPAQIREQGRQRLLEAQLVFARNGSDGPVRFRGTLYVDPIHTGGWQLDVDPRFGERGTPLVATATWRDLMELGATASLELALQRQELPQYFPIGPRDDGRRDGGEPVTVSLVASNGFQWTNWDDERIGRLMTDMGPPGQHPAAIGAGVKAAIERTLLEIPIEQLQRVPL